MPQSQGTDQQQQLQAAQINGALGTFLLFFAGIILIAVLFTDTLLGRLTNLAAACIIGLIGSIMFLRSRKQRRS
jgi:Flp pilus assembly protein TadB